MQRIIGAALRVWEFFDVSITFLVDGRIVVAPQPLVSRCEGDVGAQANDI
jgi:hypothetical protein